MESELIVRIGEEVKAKRGAALAIMTRCEGASPGKEGFMLGVFEDGSIIGTLGGGSVELSAISKAKECLRKGKGGIFTFDLGVQGNLGMLCGGMNEIYVKVFKSPEKLLIVGGGHIGLELYRLSEMLGFKAIIFEDREDFGNPVRFPNAEIFLGDYKENLKNYPIDEKCYITIATKGHRFDEAALEGVVNSNAAYIGMIGSSNKIKTIMNNLLDKGISEENIKKVYAPMGLKIGGDTPPEIAVSIFSEILLVKNNGSLEHMKKM